MLGLLAMPEFHMRVVIQVPILLLSVQPPAEVRGKAVESVSGPWASAINEGDSDFLKPGLSFAQSKLLPLFGNHSSGTGKSNFS